MPKKKKGSATAAIFVGVRIRPLLGHDKVKQEVVKNMDGRMVVALDPASPHLPLLASQQRRWALWVDSDADAFRRAYRTLKILRRHPGPSRLLALHAPGLPRAGLLSNLQHGARHFLDIELVVLSP